MKNKKVIIITSSVVFAVIALMLAFLFMIYPGERIARGISIDGIDVGGMYKADARLAIEPAENMDNTEFLLSAAGASVTFKGADIELVPDSEKTVESAYMLGRDGNFSDNVITLSKLAFKGLNIPCEYSYNREKLYEIIYNMGVAQNGELKNYTLEYGNDTVKVSLGTAGQSHNLDAQIAEFDKALLNKSREIKLELIKEEPSFPSAMTLYDEIYISPVDASYEVKNNRLKLASEVVGREINLEDAEREIEAVKSGRVVEIKLIKTSPKVTKDSIIKENFGNVLGSYTTNYPTGDRGRRTNVELAARLINDVVLMPGEVFSFNKIVGKRTAAAGFMEAPVFSNGETVQGTGGGICQVSTTLYSAVLYADLEVVNRRNHSMTIAYAPRGQDATVSYGAIDFKFKNNTDTPIRISAKGQSGKLTVSITAGKTQNKVVKIINQTVATNPPTTKETITDTLAPGVRKQVSKGKTGYTVDTYKKVYINGQEVKSEKVSRSVYKMVPNEVMVGREKTPLPTTPSDVPVIAPTVVPDELIATPAPTKEPTPGPTPSPMATPVVTQEPKTESE